MQFNQQIKNSCIQRSQCKIKIEKSKSSKKKKIRGINPLCVCEREREIHISKME